MADSDITARGLLSAFFLITHTTLVYIDCITFLFVVIDGLALFPIICLALVCVFSRALLATKRNVIQSM